MKLIINEIGLKIKLLIDVMPMILILLE